MTKRATRGNPDPACSPAPSWSGSRWSRSRTRAGSMTWGSGKTSSCGSSRTTGGRSRWPLDRRPAAVITFHARHKYLLMAHSPSIQKELGRLVAGVKGMKPGDFLREYETLFMRALACLSTPKKNTNVLMHLCRLFPRPDRGRREEGAPGYHRAVPEGARAPDRAGDPHQALRAEVRRGVPRGPVLPGPASP